MPNYTIKILPPADYLRACFDYNPETGELRWKHRPLEHFATTQTWIRRNARFANAIAGSIEPNGYRVIELDHRAYKAHRIIFKLMTGEDTSSELDHKDGNRTNNRWDNLRLATDAEQQWNAPQRKNNTSGYKGIFRHHGKWRAEIRFKGCRHIIGRFNTAEEAAAAYEAAARQLHGEFFRSS